MTHTTKHTPLDKATRAIPMLYAEAFAGSNNKEFVVELYEDARLLEKAAPAMYEALKDLIGDLGDLHGGSIAELQCHWCGRDYEDEEAGGLCTSDDCPGYIARQALSQAEGRDK